MQISSVIAVTDDSEIDKIQTQTLCCKYTDVITTLNNIQCDHNLNEDEIQNMFNSLIKNDQHYHNLLIIKSFFTIYMLIIFYLFLFFQVYS